MENIEASEKLKLSAENLNSVLSDSIRKISATKKRTKKLKDVSRLRSIRKKKETKLEIPSFLKKSAARINKQVSAPAFNLFGNILGFVSLILFGTLINNVDKIQEEINKAKEKLEKDLKPLIDIGKTIYDGAQGFIDLFDGEDRDAEYNKILEENKKLEKLKTDFLGLGEQFKLMEKQYEDINKGNYEIPKIKPKGEMSNGTTYEYYPKSFTGGLKNNSFNFLNNEPGRFVVTYPDGSTENLSYSEFITRFGNEIPNIIKKNDTQTNYENIDFSSLYNMNMDSSPFMIEGLKFNYKDLDLGLLNDIDFVNMDNTKTIFLYQKVKVNANQN